ncbi:MAG: cyclic nucleotide-binding domain-containing protein [Elusimicrobiales bacterium]|nr:cyclic nucleotide-binding domain-containing protein [Elusimicrobiales bacterium]
MRILSNIYDEGTLRKIEFLRRIRLFEGISKKSLIHVLENLQERTYLKGETIFAEGDIGRALFIVFSGKVTLTKLNPETGKAEPLAEVNPGEFFGEMALLEEMPRSAGAAAAEETQVFMLFKTKLESLLFSYPRIGVVIASQLAKILSARLRAKTGKVAEEA